MNRRNFLATSSGVVIAAMPSYLQLRTSDAVFNEKNESRTGRQPVLVRTGFTRNPDGTNKATTGQQTVVRSLDSEGRLSAFVVPVGEHARYRGAPLHVHHEQDEWIHILAGEFVAEVGGKRIRLSAGDSLLMPMKIPHRWSVAETAHCGAVHLYTPAGLMDAPWDPRSNDTSPETLELRKAEFEKHGLTLLGLPLTKEEIEQTK
jgi:quercetin dioxygenase-like cupin family protein